ncbi:MAG: hypothetical protein EF811_04990 [Methanonatronarchaeia archaeon]|nr:MAG: hypothetical protein EF811_04990 [Methanonatronarchaeia archaeon]
MKIKKIHSKLDGKLVKHNNGSQFVFIPQKWIDFFEINNQVIEKRLIQGENGEFHLMISAK